MQKDKARTWKKRRVREPKLIFAKMLSYPKIQQHISNLLLLYFKENTSKHLLKLSYSLS